MRTNILSRATSLFLWIFIRNAFELFTVINLIKLNPIKLSYTMVSCISLFWIEREGVGSRLSSLHFGWNGRGNWGFDPGSPPHFGLNGKGGLGI